jgi:hypothetical protein
MLKTLLGAALVGAAAAVPVNTTGGGVPYSWCFGAPLEEGTAVAARQGAEFRGSFRDFTLWLEDGRLRDASCTRFARHKLGNDGMWVIEYDDEPLMLTERARMAEIGIAVLATRGKSLIVGGGEKAADKLGYDACGAEDKKSFISVPSRDVSGPRKMAATTKAYYQEQLKEKRQLNLDLLEFISEEELTASISHMQDYESRNSFAGDNGLNQAVEWAEQKLLDLGFEVTRECSTACPPAFGSSSYGRGWVRCPFPR